MGGGGYQRVLIINDGGRGIFLIGRLRADNTRWYSVLSILIDYTIHRIFCIVSLELNKTHLRIIPYVVTH